MKNLIFGICLLLCSQAQAQPVSFGGITPGKTTREELKILISSESVLKLGQQIYDVGTNRSSLLVDLINPEGKSIVVSLQGDVVYRVELPFINVSDADVKIGLLQKYGVPSIKSGAIRRVTCRNGFGASFVRVEGDEELRWPIKNGVQAFLQRSAGSCSEYVTEDYVIQHVATIKALKAAELAMERKESESKRKKLDAAL